MKKEEVNRRNSILNIIRNKNFKNQDHLMPNNMPIKRE